MNIYKPTPAANDYDSLLAVNEEDEKLVVQLMGGSHWYERPELSQPIPVEIYSQGKSGDFPCFVTLYYLTLNEKALSILQPIMAESVELLPLVCNTGERYFVMKIVDVIDCLDHSRAVIRRGYSGHVAAINSFAFKEECIGDRNIFRLPELNQPLVSQAFKDCVENNGLKGLKFKQVT